MRIAVICLLLFSVIFSASADNALISKNEIGVVKIEKDDRAVPQKINLQGYLTDTLNHPRHGDFPMSFRLYDVPTGGSNVWMKDTTAFVDSGLFTAPQAIPSSHFLTGAQRWIEIWVSGLPFTNRVEITSSAFAYKSIKSDSASYAYAAPVVRPISPPIGTSEIADDSITSTKIRNGTIQRVDVVSNFKAPYSDTADYSRVAPAVDSARVSAIAHNAYKLQGKDTIALSNKFVDEGQGNSISSSMIIDGTIVNSDISSVAGISDSKISGTGNIVTNLNADKLDGLNSTDFLNTSNDYGRPGVSLNLYEGNTALTALYINEGQSASGDLSGTYPNPTVAKIQNRQVSASAPGNGQILK